jgi:hypothetical protein
MVVEGFLTEVERGSALMIDSSNIKRTAQETDGFNDG